MSAIGYRTAIVAVLAIMSMSPPALAGNDNDRATALFAGGCFWCMQEAYDAIEGVLGTEVGFAGGHVENPTYGQVVDGGTGHLEVVRIEYDPQQVSYEELLHVFWRNVDPLDDGGQFCDRGAHYRAAIFADGERQYRAASASREDLEHSGRFDQPIATEIRDHAPFYRAGEYHQDYYLKRPFRYRLYVRACGRYDRLDEVWGDEARPGQG